MDNNTRINQDRPRGNSRNVVAGALGLQRIQTLALVCSQIGLVVVAYALTGHLGLLLGGLLFTSFVASFLMFVSGQRTHQEVLIDERTAELALTANRLHAILNASTHTVIVATNLDGVITLFNSGAERLLGFSAEEIIGKLSPAAFHLREEMDKYVSEIRQKYGYSEEGIQAIFAAVKDGRYENRDWTFVRKDGSQLTVNLSLAPKLNRDEVIVGFVGVAHNVTEVRRANERFRVLFEQSSDAHIIFDDSGIIDCNTAAIQMLRCNDKHMVLGLHPAELSPELQHDGRRSMEKCVEMDSIARRNGYHRFDWTHRRRDGEDFLCKVTLTPVILEGRSALLVVWHDLTERQKAQQALIVSEERLRLSLDNSKQCIWDWNIETGELFLDDGWSELFGFEVKDQKQRVENLHAIIHPEDLNEVRQSLAAHLASDQSEYNVDYRAQSKSGDWIWVNGSGRVCHRDQTGRPMRMIGTVQDISNRKKSENTLAQRASELARSNSELEQFAYVASHDLREPLRMVQSFCTLLSESYGSQLDDRARTYIGFAVDGASRMQRLVDDLLEFSRVGRNDEPLGWVSLDSAVHAAWKNLAAAVDETNATLDVETLPVVFGNYGRIEQLFQNLIGNAIKFRGSVAPYIRITADQIADKWHITTTDNGIGIEADQIDKLFTIFQRLHTRDEYEGTGIGLAVCKRIVEFHGGRIWIESDVGRGTSVHFTATGHDDLLQNPGQNSVSDRIVSVPRLVSL